MTNDHIQIWAVTNNQKVVADIVYQSSTTQSIKIAVQAVSFTPAAGWIVALIHFQFNKSMLKKG